MSTPATPVPQPMGRGDGEGNDDPLPREQSVEEGIALAVHRMMARWDDASRALVQACTSRIAREYRTTLAEIEAALSQRAETDLIALMGAELRQALARSTAPAGPRLVEADEGEMDARREGAHDDGPPREALAARLTSGGILRFPGAPQVELPEPSPLSGGPARPGGAAEGCPDAPTETGESAGNETLRVSTGAPDLCEGTVRVDVHTEGSVRQTVQLLGALRKNPDFRVLQIMGDSRCGQTSLWLGLRRPLPLREVLLHLPGVLEVTAMEDGAAGVAERVMAVWVGKEGAGGEGGSLPLASGL